MARVQYGEASGETAFTFAPGGIIGPEGTDGQTLGLDYAIAGGSVLSITLNPESLSIIVRIATTDDKTAEKWFESNIWRNGRGCPHCGSKDTKEGTHPRLPYRCSECHKHFSVKMGTVMESSKLGYRKWAIVTYQFTTNLKGISSMKIHRDLPVTQKTAWFMVQRLRES